MFGSPLKAVLGLPSIAFEGSARTTEFCFEDACSDDRICVDPLRLSWMVQQTWRFRVAKDTIFDTVRSLAKQEVRVLLTGLSLQRFVLRKCEVHMLALRDPAQLSICGDIETCGLRVTHESLSGG